MTSPPEPLSKGWLERARANVAAAARGEPEPYPDPYDGAPIALYPAPPSKRRPPGEPMPCPECGEVMGNPGGLATHRRAKHAAAPRPGSGR
jgi:hypothetical protein